MQNNANEMAVFNTAIYVRLSKEDIVAAQSGRESNSITNQKQLILDFLKDKPEFNIALDNSTRQYRRWIYRDEF